VDDDDDEVDDVMVYRSNILTVDGRRGRRRVGYDVIPHEFKNDSKVNSYVAKELLLKDKGRAL
jgi:hypothetical protein